MKILFTLFIILFYTSASAQSYAVMSYNIRFDNPDDGVNAWPLRKHKVTELIIKYNPDIIGVQEALQHQLDDIVLSLPAYQYVGVGRDDGKAKGEYSAILYKKEKFTIQEQSTFWLSETPDVPGSKSWDAAITRVATTAVLKDKEKKQSILVINTHYDHMGAVARQNSSSLILKKIAERKNKFPTILMGDFNSKPTESPYKEIINSTEPKLTDAAPDHVKGTFCSFVVGSIECYAIDYIFHSREWKSSNYQVIEDNDGERYPSDHLPVMTELSLNK